MTDKEALGMIFDIGFDYDGYEIVEGLKKLIDEMVTLARNQTMPPKPTLLVIFPGSEGGDSVYTLMVEETGECLYQHLCSHAGFAYSDLYGRREERVKELAERFGEVEVKFINQTKITEGELIARNHEFYEKKKAEAQASQIGC